MRKTDATGDVWKDLDGAKAFFGCGRLTVERIASAADAKRKVGKRALYNIRKMDSYLNEKGA